MKCTYYCAERDTLYTSEWILDELAEKPQSKKFKLTPPLQEIISLQVKEDAQLVYPTNELPTLSRDPNDNNVLQVALFVNANFLITEDSDLLVLEQVANTRIINSKTFFDRYIA